MVSAVLFAKDFTRLTAFYREVVGLALTSQQEDHAILTRPGFDLVVHQIPAALAGSIAIETPPRRREHAAIKLCFPVPSLEAARARAASLGGVLDPPSAEWTDEGVTSCPGHDPEGNVFQVSVRAEPGSGR